MKRTYANPLDRANETLEANRRLYRAATDVAKRLDEQKTCVLTTIDIFTPSNEALRCKLRGYCERLILKDPVSHARKIEELLWRRAFYDAVANAKKLRKGNSWNEAEKAVLSTHIQVGVGYYHHLILRLQEECSLDLSSIVDFAFPTVRKEKIGKLNSEEAQQCALKIIHRSLICLGDLARYTLDVDPNWDPMIATRYYKMAIAVDPSIGMPHNQLGTLSGHRNHGIDAVYHYLRCTLCSESFEGTEGNLKRVISTNFYAGIDKSPLQRCAAKLFNLLQKWDNESSSAEKIKENCENLLMEIENCLNCEIPLQIESKDAKKANSIEEFLQTAKSDQPNFLTEDLVFKIIAICLMSISKLQMKNSLHIKSVMAFTLSLLSKLLHITTLRIEEKLLETSLINEKDLGDLSFITFVEKSPENDELDINVNDNKTNPTQKNGNLNGNSRGAKKNREKSRNLLSKLRRPRKKINSSDSESMSDGEDEDINSSSDEMASDMTESDQDNNLSDGNIFDDISDEELENDEEVGQDTTNPTQNDASSQKITENGHKISTESQNNVSQNDSPQIDENQLNGHSSLKNSNFVLLAQLKKQGLNTKEMMEILNEVELLQSIKICFDWIQSHPMIVTFIATEMRTLLKKTVVFLNLVKIGVDDIVDCYKRETGILRDPETFGNHIQKVPLPEDIDLKGLDVLNVAHEKIDWKILRNISLYKMEEVILRIQKLASFGEFLESFEESGVVFDKKKKMFLIREVDQLKSNGSKNENGIQDENKCGNGNENGNKSENKLKSVHRNESNGKNDHKKELNDQNKGKLMRHMGKLWLKAEVRALESRLKSKLMSAYLVPDHEALAKYTPLLKRLMYAKKFIIVIPSVVVSALDEVKRSSGRVREATRWLESQLRKGSRFLRAQRPHEKLTLPYIKAPKTKDKEAWLFFQIVECCHYLTHQSNIGLSGDAEPPVVTLLTGISAEERKHATFSPDGLSKTAGINLEHIETFHTKWKTSSKSHG